MKEIWKPVIGYENTYEISNRGRLRRAKAHRGTWRGRILKQTHDAYGYIQATLSQNNIKRKIKVHRLVLKAFIGPCPSNMEANHKNGQKDDNRIENLEWVTSSRNKLHSYQVLDRRAVFDHKLNFVKAEEIRTLYASGQYSYNSLARQFDVHRTTIWAVVKYRIWKHA